MGGGLLEPDSFANDWYGWVTNQSGHFLLGIIIAWVTGRVWTAILIALAFEIAQWSPDLVDSASDVAFTVSGAVFQVYANSGVLLPVVIALFIGFAQRSKNGRP